MSSLSLIALNPRPDVCSKVLTSPTSSPIVQSKTGESVRFSRMEVGRALQVSLISTTSLSLDIRWGAYHAYYARTFGRNPSLEFIFAIDGGAYPTDVGYGPIVLIHLNSSVPLEVRLQSNVHTPTAISATFAQDWGDDGIRDCYSTGRWNHAHCFRSLAPLVHQEAKWGDAWHGQTLSTPCLQIVCPSSGSGSIFMQPEAPAPLLRLDVLCSVATSSA